MISSESIVPVSKVACPPFVQGTFVVPFHQKLPPFQSPSPGCGPGNARFGSQVRSCATLESANRPTMDVVRTTRPSREVIAALRVEGDILCMSHFLHTEPRGD